LKSTLAAFLSLSFFYFVRSNSPSKIMTQSLRRLSRLLLIGALLSSSGLLRAEPVSFTVKLWPGMPPQSIESSTYKEIVIYRDNDTSKPRVSQVTSPALEVFLPEKDKACGSAVVICPGGGYSVLAYDHEGIQVAKWFQSRGVAGVILRYRLPSDQIMKDKSVGPLQDVQEAIRVVRRKAAEWNIKANQIGVMGFSAGGHLAGTATTLYARQVYQPDDNTSARPDFSILVYGVLSMQRELTHKGSHDNLLGKDADKAAEDSFSSELHVDANTPPTFLIHAADDKTVPVENSLRFHAAMLKNKVPGELHVFEKGGHGFGLGINPGSPAHWPDVLAVWLKSRGLLK
jgi:acetyl esterase/lipase